MKISVLSAVAFSTMLSVAAFAHEHEGKKPGLKDGGPTCEHCTKKGKKCKCKGECKCGDKHHKDAKAEEKSAEKPAVTETPAEEKQ